MKKRVLVWWKSLKTLKKWGGRKYIEKPPCGPPMSCHIANRPITTANFSTRERDTKSWTEHHSTPSQSVQALYQVWMRRQAMNATDAFINQSMYRVHSSQVLTTEHPAESLISAQVPKYTSQRRWNGDIKRKADLKKKKHSRISSAIIRSMTQSHTIRGPRSKHTVFPISNDEQHPFTPRRRRLQPD